MARISNDFLSSLPSSALRITGEIEYEAQRHPSDDEPGYITSLPQIQSEESLPHFQSKAAEEPVYLHGWRLYLTTATLGFVVFIVTLEVSIVTTALISISNSLGGSNQSSWIITAYLVTYTSFLIIWAKLSDIFGRKPLCAFSIAWFVAFSGACAASSTTTSLIVYRALQGIGGSGCYAISVAIFFELVPPKLFAAYTSMISGILALALVVGPLFGGLISEYSSWRWVFLINVPAGAASLVALLISLPNGFPNLTARKPSLSFSNFRDTFSRGQLARLDLPGTFMLLAATALSITVLEEGGNQFAWASPLIVSICWCSGLLWISFLFWSKYVTTKAGVREPVFPWRFMQSRARVGMLLTIFLTGAPFHAAIVEIPLRLQIIGKLSPLNAGISLLPFALLNPFGSVVAPFIAKRFKVPPVYMLFFGSALQTAGIVLLSTLPRSSVLSGPFYAYEAIAGLGIGIALACLIVMTPFSVERRDKAVAMGAMVQFRTLGGAVGIAVATAVVNGYVRGHLSNPPFSSEQIDDILGSSGALNKLPQPLAALAGDIFADAYNLQMRAMIGFCAAQLLSGLLMWQRPQVKV